MTTCSADLTVTFGTHKVAHLVDPAALACGVVHLVDIGLDLPLAPVEALQPVDVAVLLPIPGPFEHKYTRGVVGVRAGSETYPGAAVLCTSGAVSGLAGMVRYAGSAADAVRAAHPEIVVADGRVQAWVVGSGGDADAEQALADALADGVPTVVDADALMHVRRGPRGPGPHPARRRAGPDARRRARGRSRPTSSPSSAAPRRSTTPWCSSRDAGTLIARPDGRVRVTTSGVPWLAVAGAGDVLAGRDRLAAGRRSRPVGRRVRRLLAARRGRRSGQRRWTAHRDAGGRRDPGGGAHAACREWENGPDGRAATPVRTPRSSSTSARCVTTWAGCASWSGEDQPDGQLMVVVKADGYGHGMVPVARAARSAGAEWLGVATGDEALALREAGDTGRVLCWLAAPGADFAPLRRGRRRRDGLTRWPSSTRSSAVPARPDAPPALQLKVDTGLSRDGAAARRVAGPGHRRPVRRRTTGAVRVTGVWSHLACSDEPEHPANAAQQEAFEEALALAADAGLDPEVRHLANSAGALLHPRARLRPRAARHRRLRASARPPTSSRPRQLGLVPAMTVRGTVVLTKELAAGAGVSYGHTFVAEEPMRVALVPMGYGDGDPAARLQRRRGARRRRPRARARPDLHGPVRRRRPRGARRRRGRAVRRRDLTGSPPRPTGRDGAGRSTTRSSPGWVAGRPASGSGKRTGVSTRRSLAYAAGGLGAAAARGRRHRCRRRAPRREGAPRRRRRGRPAGRAALRARRGHLRRRSGAARRGRRGGAVRRLEDRPPSHGPRRRDPGLRARLRAQPRLLALPARGVPRQAPDGVLRPALARPLRAVATASTPRSTSSATTCASVIETVAPKGEVVLVGHSMGGMSIIAFAERHPELFAKRVAGVALIATTAGGLRPHRTVSRWIPDGIGQLVAPRVIAALAKAPELVDSARRSGSNIGFLVADMFAFGRKDVPAAEVEFLDEMLAGTTFDVLAEFFPNFTQLDKFEHLAAFDEVPTTIICGTKDKLTSIGHSRKMAEQLPPAHGSWSATAPGTW